MSGKTVTGEMQLNFPDVITRGFMKEITEFSIELPVGFYRDAKNVVSTEQQDVNGS